MRIDEATDRIIKGLLVHAFENDLQVEKLLESHQHLIRKTIADCRVRPLGNRYRIEHDGFMGTVIGDYVTLEGKSGVVLQLDGARVVHVYGEKWLIP